MKTLEKLLNYLNEIESRSYIVNLMHWEMDTIAPKKSYDYLIEVKNKVEMECFKMSTSQEFKDLVNKVIEDSDFENLSLEEKRYLKDLLEDIKREERVPENFMNEYLTLCDKSNNAWAEAKEKNDYSIFKPYLEEIVRMTKEYYRYMYPDCDNLYDRMLDTYEKGMTSKEIDKLFDELKKEIIPLVKNLKIKNLPKIKNKYSDSELIEISKILLDYIGFDNERGALGIYPHGYTNKINNNDVRIAFSQNKSIFDHVCTIIHEGGHGIFEQSIGKTLSKYATYSIDKYALHESQSRFFENILGRNKSFWKPIYEDLKGKMKLDLSLDEFIEYLNDAKPSFKRTEADELTYCLHIIMRYEIERDLFADKISAKDLETIWNEKTKEYFDLEVETASDGILQDVHWSQGSFGYFPSYLLGSILDGMILEAIERDLGSIDELLSTGRIKEITKYLQENIHTFGGAYTFMEVVSRIYKKELSIEPLVNYFKSKYQN
ncbi:MAG: carboxypeptidase M32 [Bacilli bacterium]|nr:carboxypeptidase M32 [Bacilli bacterium]